MDIVPANLDVPAKWAASVATLFIGIILTLIGAIYHSINRRLENCEGKNEQIFETVTLTAADVKHIKGHCVMCDVNAEREL